MNTSKAIVVASAILGKVRSIIGYTLVILCGLPLVMGTYTGGVGTYIFAVVFIGGGVLLIISGAKATRRVKRFKRYVSLISTENMTSLQDLAGATSQSTDFVKNDLQKMISKSFFANASIDSGTGEIIIGNGIQAAVNAPTAQASQIEMVNVKCTGCGAVNSKQKGMSGSCDYCGSPLQ